MVRRKKIAGLSDEGLERRFWEMTDRVVGPLVELARRYTSPSIERSVLLRMGFSDAEAGAIVQKCLDHRLLGKGAGHVVWKVSRAIGTEYREAGKALAEGRHWDEAVDLFTGPEVSRPAAGR